MKAIMVMFDSLNRHFLPNYGCKWTKMPNFERLGERTITFDSFYGGSMPCMPARRELHTGRYNFLHSPWSPMQPYDDSIITRLRKNNIYTHICTDHFHYWEDGGSCYLTKFDSHETIRGQQGDKWKGQVTWPDFPDTLSRRKTGESWRHDWINRQFLIKEDDMPQNKTFAAGLDFLERNFKEDNWFLQIEAFDPHEPFYSLEEYKKLYNDEYNGKNLDWPDYGKNEYGDEATKHVNYEYAALMSMCDKYMGKIIDFMDKHDMWKDTLLIVNTDHGFMLGEKEWMGKNVQPFYEELIHIPFFIHDPRNPHPGERRNSLAQTIDIVALIAEYFEISPPDFMDGKSITPIITNDEKIRDGALFGMFGGHINITDGRYVYMKAPICKDNSPIYQYNLMPCHMDHQFSAEELKGAELYDKFNFTLGAKVLKIPYKTELNAYWYGDLLFDLKNDPSQNNPIKNSEIENKMIQLMKKMMDENEAPFEQFIRIGIIDNNEVKKLIEKDKLLSVNINFEKSNVNKIINIYYFMLSTEEKRKDFMNHIKNIDSSINEEEIFDLIKKLEPENKYNFILRLIKNYL